MKRILIILGIVAIGAFGLLISDRKENPEQMGKIESFHAEDMPYDDGSGVLLRWKPLDKSHRIIQYNIYRGVHPDSLFMLSHLEVDPKMGVLSNELFFFDKDYPTLIDFETAPARLRREKQQAPGSPLFRRVPRDPAVLATLIDRYDVLAMIKNRELYHKTRKLTAADSSFTAGMRLNQFEYLLANVKEGQKYYYSVLGVNERGQLLPFADIREAIPVDNRPDSTAVVRSVMLTDTREMRFEWNPPSAARDIALWEAWLMPKANLGAYLTAQRLNEENPQEGDNSSLWKQGAIPVFQIPNEYFAPVYYHTEALDGPAAQIDPENYNLILGYMDYGGLYAYSMGRPIVQNSSDNLPVVPDFRIMDKKNDKGDNLYVSIGKPIVFITQASYTNSRRERLRINYESSPNEAYTIDKIRFSFFDAAGRELGTVIEHFPDQVIHLRLPRDRAADLTDITVKIALKTTAEKDYNPDELIQHLEYDLANRRFSGNRLELAGQRLNRLFYDLYTRTGLDHGFSPGNRMGGMSRSYDVSVPYEDMLYRILSGYDTKTRRFSIDPHVMIAMDDSTGASLRIPLYREEFPRMLEKLDAEIIALKAELEGLEDPEQLAEKTTALESKEAMAAYIRSHPATLAAEGKRSNRSWLNTFLKERDFNSRRHAFKLLATNGRGLYEISDVYSKDGNIWFYPQSEWFDTTKTVTLIGSLILVLLVGYGIIIVRRKDPYIRPIAGLTELDNAVGRATEMGRPVMFVPGWGTLGEPCTISAMMILSQIARKTAEFDIRLISPHVDYFVVPLAQEMVKTAYSEVGRPDSYNQNDIFFVSDVQFAFSAAVNGITIRDRVATIFYMGYFNAEALLMTETGNQTGSIQIAASDAITQIPFFITTCDYTLIGEEFYAASAYLSKNPDIVSMLKSQDYFKLLIVLSMVVGAVLSSLHFNGFIRAFPVE